MVQAAYLVICCGWKVGKATRQRGVKNSTAVSRAIKSIRQRWKRIQIKNTYLCEEVLLRPDEMELVRRIENNNIGKLVERSRKWKKYDLENI